MSEIMKMADAYAQRAVDVEMGPYQSLASNHTQQLDAHDKSRAALVAAVEKLERDAARLNWLEQNLFNRENVDWFTGNLSQTQLMWVMFAPIGVQGSARTIIDAAMEASK